MKRYTTLLVAVIAAAGSLAAQTNQRTVHGYVIDNDGNPIAGAEVMAPGGGESVITDSDGSFSLQVSPFLKTLTATYTGMGSKKKKINFDKDMMFTLRPKWPMRGFINVMGLAAIDNGFHDESLGVGAGLMGGVIGKWGGYAKVLLDHNLKQSQVYPNITIGAIKGITQSFYGYLGLGYGKIWANSEYIDEIGGRHDWSLYNGLAIDLGFIIKPSKHFDITIGYIATSDFDWGTRHTFNVGVGYVF